MFNFRDTSVMQLLLDTVFPHVDFHHADCLHAEMM
jgi:hypothetical protein